jgi:glutamate 5-kinase
MVSADCLVLLSDIDGLYSTDPARDADAHFIAEVPRITPEIEAMAGGSSSTVGSGGMATKLAAGKIALAAGCHMCVASGREPHPLRRLDDGARCTWFIAEASPLTVRKQWIAGTLQPVGELHVDAGAVHALRGGRSLLPAGVTRIDGRFDRGDPVVVRGPDGAEVARGLSAYSHADAERIRGRRSSELPALLGFRGRDEMIHRDDLVLT